VRPAAEAAALARGAELVAEYHARERDQRMQDALRAARELYDVVRGIHAQQAEERANPVPGYATSSEAHYHAMAALLANFANAQIACEREYARKEAIAEARGAIEAAARALAASAPKL
jgi:hypothetical protein